MYQLFGRFILFPVYIRPRLLSDRRIRLPRVFHHPVCFPALHVPYLYIRRIPVLRVYNYLFVPVKRAVVVVSHECVECVGDTVHCPVEPEQLRLILIHQFIGMRQEILFGTLVVFAARVQAAPTIQRDSRILHVGRKRHPPAEEPRVFKPVRREAEYQAFLLGCGFQQSDHVLLRPHPDGIPPVMFTVVEGKAVMMLSYGYHVFGARGLEQRYPLVGVKLLALEHGDKVLVAEFRMIAVGRDMMLVCRRAFLVHKASVPVGFKGRHGTKPPVYENPELSVLKPCRKPVMFRHILPVWLEYGCAFR